MNTLGPKMAIGVLVLILLVFATWNTTTSLFFGLPITVVLLWLLVILAFVIPLIFIFLMEKIID
ncbi:hypothetical protein [Virgibacillus kimchii]